MPNKSSRGLASGDVGKIAFAAVAIVAAIVFVVFYIKSQQGHEAGHVNTTPGSSMKLNAMKRMKGGGGFSPGSEGPGQSSPAGSTQ